MGDDDDELNINRTTVGDHGTQGAEHFLIVCFVGANDAGAASGGHLTFGGFASFVFLEKLLFLRAQRRAARNFGGFEKALDGPPLLGPGGGPQPQKPRLLRGKPPVLRVQFGHSGALFWAYGQIRAAGRDVN